MGKDLKKTLPNPECELLFFFFFLGQNNGIVGKKLKVTH